MSPSVNQFRQSWPCISFSVSLLHKVCSASFSFHYNLSIFIAGAVDIFDFSLAQIIFLKSYVIGNNLLDINYIRYTNALVAKKK